MPMLTYLNMHRAELKLTSWQVYVLCIAVVIAIALGFIAIVVAIDRKVRKWKDDV